MIAPLNQQRYTILSCLGKGGYGLVQLACDHVTGKHVAIKRPLRGPDTFKHEQNMLECLQNVVGIPQLLGTISLGPASAEQEVALVLEYIEGKRMSDIPTYSLPLPIVCSWVTELFTILAEIHSHLIVHHDLHNHNILLGNDTHVHVIDFGAAHIVQTQHPSFSIDLEDMIIVASGWVDRYPQETHDPDRKAIRVWLEQLKNTLIERQHKRKPQTPVPHLASQEEANHILHHWQQLLATRHLQSSDVVGATQLPISL